jgi:phosphopantothenoylcysteine decarboxylase/phosphopantothenate--cysteine ligase
MKKTKEIILGITGSISAYKSCDLLRLLRNAGFNISVIMTKEATNFIKPLTFQTLSGNRVYQDLFEETVEWNPKHISLAKRANLVVIAPATANFIGKLANGICDDLLSCVCLATQAKIILCPAMNENMYRYKVVQTNLKKLKELGFIVIGPVKGRLASGDIGIGHLAELEDILKVIRRHLK